MIVIGVLVGFCLNYFFPDMGKGRSFLIAGILVIMVGGFLFYKIYKAAHELPPGAKTIDKSEVTKDL